MDCRKVRVVGSGSTNINMLTENHSKEGPVVRGPSREAAEEAIKKRLVELQGSRQALKQQRDLQQEKFNAASKENQEQIRAVEQLERRQTDAKKELQKAKALPDEDEEDNAEDEVKRSALNGNIEDAEAQVAKELESVATLKARVAELLPAVDEVLRLIDECNKASEKDAIDKATTVLRDRHDQLKQKQKVEDLQARLGARRG